MGKKNKGLEHLYEFQCKEKQGKNGGQMQGNAYGRHEIDAGFGINSSSASCLRQSAQSPQNSQPQMVSSEIPVTH